MKISHALLCLSCLAVLTLIPARAGESKPAIGAGSVIVHSKFGGQIFGFDIDANGSEGILSWSTSLPGANYLATAETNLHARERTPSMNLQLRVSFLTNNPEVRTIAATSALSSILPDRMTGESAVASSKTGLGSTTRFSI